MKMLQARLYEAELKSREEAAQAEHDAKTDIGWGHQIRSYVLHPYQMVKDLRTNVETGNAQGVLDGDLDRFLEAALADRLGGDEAVPKRTRPKHPSRSSGPAHGVLIVFCGQQGRCVDRSPIT